MTAAITTPILERQLLLQLGDRLRQLRKAKGLGTVEMALAAGMSRTTLAAIEAGDPGPSMGNYLRVMTVLGVAADLALLASDTFVEAPPRSAAARSARSKPIVQVSVKAAQHDNQVQELQSLVLHEKALAKIKAQPELVSVARRTVSRWMEANPQSRTMPLWQAWLRMLDSGSLRGAVERTQRAQRLRQASPLVTVLDDEERAEIINQVQALKSGVTLSSPGNDEGDFPVAQQP